MTARFLELWPALLTKALIKVARPRAYGGGSGTQEFGDFSPIHCLTGWLPQTIAVRIHWKSPAAVAVDGKQTGKTASEAKIERRREFARSSHKQQQRPEAVVFASFYNASRRQPLLLASLADGADKSETTPAAEASPTQLSHSHCSPSIGRQSLSPQICEVDGRGADPPPRRSPAASPASRTACPLPPPPASPATTHQPLLEKMWPTEKPQVAVKSPTFQLAVSTTVPIFAETTPGIGVSVSQRFNAKKVEKLIAALQEIGGAAAVFTAGETRWSRAKSFLSMSVLSPVARVLLSQPGCEFCKSRRRSDEVQRNRETHRMPGSCVAV
uniref:ATP-dependent DNA helicase n=1 Tax=Macrostomum lignano TaxID=282301 RepID=A0A1I8F3U6_9PLAT